MTPLSPAADQAPARLATTPLALGRELFLLAKPRLSSLVLLTTSGGMWLAPGRIHPARAAITVL